MSEMVERVARAICGTLDESGTDKNGSCCICTMPNQICYDAIIKARAAIKAMREPTEAMGIKGSRVRITTDAWWSEKTRHAQALSDAEMGAIGAGDVMHGNWARWSMPTWRAMIDEALR